MKIKPSYCKYILHGYMISIVLVVLFLFLPENFLNYIIGLPGPHSVRLGYLAMEQGSRNALEVLWFLGFPIAMSIGYFVTTSGKNYTPWGVMIGLEGLVSMGYGVGLLLVTRYGQGLYAILAGLFSIAVAAVCILASQKGKRTEFGVF